MFTTSLFISIEQPKLRSVFKSKVFFFNLKVTENVSQCDDEIYMSI